MNRILTPVLALGLMQACAFAQKPEGKEEDLLFFGIPAVEDKVQQAPAKPESPSVTSAPSNIPLAKKAAESNLLLLGLPRDSFATARLAKMHASGSQAGTEAAPKLIFSKATPSLQQAVERATALLRERIKKFPDGVTVRFEIDGNYGGHEMDSAGLAAAVLLESLASGRQLDPNVALLGGIGEGGKVTKVYGVGTRLRSLEGIGPGVVGVPMEAEPEVRDLALMGELEALVRMPVFALAGLEDGVALADSAKQGNLAKAIELFASVQEAASKSPLEQLVKNPKFQQRLNDVLAAAPHHLSARLLLQAGTGKLPGRMTFLTSQQAILKSVKPFWDLVYKGGSKEEIQRTATTCGNALNQIQFKVHAVTERYLVATRTYLRALNNFLDIPATPKYHEMRVKGAANVKKCQDDIRIEKEKLDQLKEVKE